MKKILLINLTPRGGMLHYASQFSNALGGSKDFHHKIAIASYANTELYNTNAFIKIRTNPSLGSFFIDSINIFYHIHFLVKIIKYKPDIVHFLDNHPWYIVYVHIFKLLGYTIYTTQHDPILHSGEDKNMLGKISAQVNKVLRNSSDTIFVHGEKLRREMAAVYNISEDTVFSIRHGSYNFFSRWAQGLPTQKNNFLFFGRIVDYKGLYTLLLSLEYVKQSISDFRLIIAGPGDIAKYKDLLEKHSANIELINTHIEPEDAYKYFETSEFVVLPYTDASGSGVIPVAYSFSKAVLVTSVGELPSVVEEGITGHIVKPKDPSALGKKILQMLENKEQTMQMGKNGKIFEQKELGWNDIIQKIYG